MARCKYCGVEGLAWKQRQSDGYWDLFEPDDNDFTDFHNCKPEDRKKEFERQLKEKAETDEAARRHREANGYL